MKEVEWVDVPNFDKNCFACGSENPHGLHMTFESNGEKLRSHIVIPDHLRGWRNIAHGGILATIADEIMAWSAIHLLRKFILTKNISTSFLKPVFIGTKLVAIGRVEKRIDERNAVMACEIRNEKQGLCVVSKGEFALFTTDEFKLFNLVPGDMLDKMAQSL